MSPFMANQTAPMLPVPPRGEAPELNRYHVTSNSLDSVCLTDRAISAMETLPRLQLPTPLAMRPYFRPSAQGVI